MTSIPIGPQFTMTQNVEYALPSMSVIMIQVSAVIQTAIVEGTGYANVTGSILTGAFIRCTTGNATITLRKNGVG